MQTRGGNGLRERSDGDEEIQYSYARVIIILRDEIYTEMYE